MSSPGNVFGRGESAMLSEGQVPLQVPGLLIPKWVIFSREDHKFLPWQLWIQLRPCEERGQRLGVE